MTLLLISWTAMTLTHEAGHIIGGTCCGGNLVSYDFRPWQMPYSIFAPDPRPLVTLWSGLLLGVMVPLFLALLIRREWMWFICYFCMLANGIYIATGWFTADRYLDTTKLLEHGASPASIVVYCLVTIGFGYRGFRRSCMQILSERQGG